MRRASQLCTVPLALLAVLSGCRQPAPVKAPEPVQLNIPQPTVTDGSLWQADTGRHGLVADNTARKRGDILTVLVIEDIDTKRDRSTQTSRTQSTEASVDKFVYSDLLRRKGEMPGVGLGSNRSFNGGGSIENSDSVRATLSAQVTEVLPNGNMVILAQKQVLISGDTQVITVTGIVRPEDVQSNNTVLSTHIAEARINFYGDGTLNDAQRRTLLSRLFDWVNLF